MEDNAVAEKYKTQLDELESRTPQPKNAITIAELRRIQQQLEEEVDQVRATRRQRDRERRKTAKLFRIASLYCYVSFWPWLIYMIIALSTKIGHSASLFAALGAMSVCCVIFLPLVFFPESVTSSEGKYIRNLSLLTSATERIESIRNTQPTVLMNAECYHLEERTRIVSYRDANGNYQSRTETYWEKVVTAFIVEPFLFTHWYDSSQSTLTDVRKVGITKIKMELSVQFGDQTTEQNFQEKYQGFQNENRHRDVYVNFFVSKTVDGFEKRLAAYTDIGNKPGWVRPVWFWLATFFCLGWPYRIMFNRICGKTGYSVEKVILTVNPSTPAAPTDPNHTPEPPAENAENTMDNMKKNIEVILYRLTAGLSANDGDIPMTCPATDQYMNVTLMEADHTPRRAN